MSKICQKCGNILDDNDTFCFKCGQTVETPKNTNNKNRNILIISFALTLLFTIAIITVLLILVNKDSNDETTYDNTYSGIYASSNIDSESSNQSNKSENIKFECPNFVGMNIEELKAHDKYDSFEFKFEYHNSSEFDFGIIIDQSIEPDEEVEKGSFITLFVNMGSTAIKIPNDIYGKSEQYAISKLESLGLIPIVEYISSDEVKKGNVIKTDPERTVSVIEGDEVTIYVSSGKEDVMVSVPNVIGLSKEKAKTLIESAGLIPEFELRDPESDLEFNETPKGYVLAQDPVPNLSERVLEGTVVKVYISTGVIKMYVEMPDVIGLSRKNAIAKLEEAGLAVKIILVPDNSSKNDTVLLSDYTAGQSILIGSHVTITVGYHDDNTD